MSVTKSGTCRRPEGGASIWRLPDEADPRQLTAARHLLRVEAYLAPVGGGLLAGLALSGAGASPIEDWRASGAGLALCVLLVGAASACWVAVSVRVGQRAWAYRVALALQGGLILAAAAVTCAAVAGPGGAISTAQQSGAPALEVPALLLPFGLLFVVPVATLVLLLHPASRGSTPTDRRGGTPSGR
jgi:hypothetical protein